MSQGRHSEAAFETVIEAHLLENGYMPITGEGFDRDRAIFPETVLAFIRDTQPREWAKLESLHGDKTGEQILGDLCKWMDIHGALATLRHGFKCYGRTLRAAYFKAAHELNPELESRYAANRLGLTRQLHFSPRSALRPEVGGCHAEPERHSSGHGGAEGPAYGPMGRECAPAVRAGPRFEQDSTRTSNSMQNTGQDSVRNLWLPIPPIDEQRAIVDHIGTASVKLETVHAATDSTVKLLKDRRAALIAAPVTGRNDIRATS